MVQYRSNLNEGLATKYWKLFCSLPTKELKKRLRDSGVEFSNTASQARLENLHSRLQRGLPSYENYSTYNIQDFCKARKIQPVGIMSRSKMIRALEMADEDATLTRFMDLPPDLRVIIYTLHFQDLDTSRIIPSQPPLLKASRLVRKEAFPLFYKTCRFNIQVESVLTDGRRSSEFREPSDERFVRAASTPTYPDGLRTPAQPLGHLLTKLCLSSVVWAPNARGKGSPHCLYTTFEAKDGELKVTVSEDEYGAKSELAMNALKKRAQRLLDLFRERGRLTEAEKEARELRECLAWEDDGDDDEDQDVSALGEDLPGQVVPKVQAGGEVTDVAGQDAGREKAGGPNDEPMGMTRCSRLMLEDTDMSAFRMLCFVI